MTESEVKRLIILAEDEHVERKAGASGQNSAGRQLENNSGKKQGLLGALRLALSH